MTMYRRILAVVVVVLVVAGVGGFLMLKESAPGPLTWTDRALVVEVPLHGRTEDRIDRDCTLLSAVRRLLPARAVATHSGTCAHGACQTG